MGKCRQPTRFWKKEFIICRNIAVRRTGEPCLPAFGGCSPYMFALNDGQTQLGDVKFLVEII